MSGLKKKDSRHFVECDVSLPRDISLRVFVSPSQFFFMAKITAPEIAVLLSSDGTSLNLARRDLSCILQIIPYF